MDLDLALTFARERRNAVITTLRSDGRPQQSVVFYLLDDDRFTISVTDGRAKTKNLRRDPRAALFVAGDHAFAWASFDGTVTLSPVIQDTDDEVADALVAYYRRANGEHDNWAEYRQAMVAERRLLLTFTATAATGILPD